MYTLLLLAAPFLIAAADPPGPDATAAPIPPAIRAMLDAAIAAGNDGEISTIVKYARSADPASGDAVLAVAQRWRDERDARRRETIQEARFLDLWTGKVELGGYLTTGNSDTSGLNGAVDAKREGLRWRQNFHVQADYQESLGITTREHYLVSYEPNYKVNERAYIYGQGQYESDRFLGYYNRFSTSVGGGYSVVKTAAIKLDLELGPAYRYSEATDATTQSSIAARGSVNFNWKLLPGLSIGQIASTYVQRYNSTISSATALNAKLIGPLSAQLSYNVQYESEPPIGSVSTDTTSRAALVYSF